MGLMLELALAAPWIVRKLLHAGCEACFGLGSKHISNPDFDSGRAPYVLYGVKHIDLVSRMTHHPDVAPL